MQKNFRSQSLSGSMPGALEFERTVKKLPKQQKAALDEAVRTIA